MAQSWVAGGRRGGCAPPRTPLHSGGLRPPDPPKGAPRPWLQRLVAFSRPSRLSGAAALPGAELCFSEICLFLEGATCLGQLRCPGRTCEDLSGSEARSKTVIQAEACSNSDIECLNGSEAHRNSYTGSSECKYSAYQACGCLKGMNTLCGRSCGYHKSRGFSSSPPSCQHADIT